MPLNAREFTAWIEVEGSTAKQYQATLSNDGLTATCWIASEVGKKFTVFWRKPNKWKKPVLIGGVNVDGIQCGGTICYQGKRDPISMSGFTTTNQSNRPFTFADLQLTDDDAFLDAASEQLGEISIEVWRCKVQGKRDQGSNWAPPEEQQVHERSKKATTHKVQLGHEKTGQPSMLMQTKITDTSPVVTFIFRYRPIDVLKASGVIKPIPTMMPMPMNSSGTVSGNHTSGSQGTIPSRKRPAAEPTSNVVSVKREIEDDDKIVEKFRVSEVETPIDVKHERKRVKLEPST